MARNPRDVCVSYFHHTNLFKSSYGYAGTFDDYVDFFMKGRVGCGDFWYHLKVGENLTNVIVRRC